ncbi:hypothetical protein QYE76_053602 [Lolium multiflorum]|uniref:Reverse transcriptase domain-containing protein n=1 Tax=Lolium multiflorum TaxID=4521 RepID=A0AAD8SW25_LOLMU|nr:hypothetical protein QYE76_053602 [Lolium multiflorum]
MEMTFGRFHFRVGKEGSHRLAIPDSSRSVADDSDSSGSVSSFESGEEEISPSIFTKPASSGKLVKIFSSMSFGSSADSNISSHSDSVDAFDFIDRSTSVREVFADLYDGVTDLEEKQIPKYHQICVIGESSRPEAEMSEAFDDLGNPYVDPADLMRGTQACQHTANRTPRAKEKMPPPTIEYLNWSGHDIGFTIADHPQQVPRPGQSALILPAVIAGFDVSRVFIDGGSSLNLITMSFGLKNAGATYQRMMQKCLATQIGKNVQVYIDDVVITTKQGSTLIEDLKETFGNLDRFCLKMNPTKCSSEFLQENYSGF